MDRNKKQLALVPMWFIEEMATVLESGLKNGRKFNDWQDIIWDQETRILFESSLLRHLKAAQECSPSEVARHCGSIAANAMIIAYHEMRRDQVSDETEIQEEEPGGWYSVLGLNPQRSHYFYRPLSVSPPSPLCRRLLSDFDALLPEVNNEMVPVVRCLDCEDALNGWTKP